MRGFSSASHVPLIATADARATMSRLVLAVVVLAGLVAGALGMALVGSGPWSSSPEPVPVIELDGPTGDPTAPPATTTTPAPPVTTGPGQRPEIVTPETVSPAPAPADDDDADDDDDQGADD